MTIDNYYKSKLLDWIPEEKIEINITWLSANPTSIYLLEQHPDKINWMWLSINPVAIHLLEQNKDKIDWDELSYNSAAIHLLAIPHDFSTYFIMFILFINK